ncbi:MAG: pantoate--beta-alanine ligase [Planctomycetota bacterium]
MNPDHAEIPEHDPSVLVITTGAEMRAWMQTQRAAGRRVGLVPTMGALHEGHASLMRAARRECDAVVVTIFVNPTQFAPHEDFQRYPRTLAADLAMLAAVGGGVAFVPTASEMYPHGYSTFVEPPQVAQPLEGKHRPGHFRGVATVVLKLFLLAPADIAYFGHKDYQQTRVISDLVRDLNVPIEIQVCPTIREEDGLAMSSRNRYLSADDRQRALSIYRGMRAARELFHAGERRGAVLRGRIVAELHESRIHEMDYIAVAHPETLAEPEMVEGHFLILVAARLGTTRLIDNLPLAVGDSVEPGEDLQGRDAATRSCS